MGRLTSEWLVGARSQREFDSILDSMRGLTHVGITPQLWESAARLGYGMRRAGLTVGLPDLVVAQCAIVSERVLWPSDHDFDLIQRHSALQARFWEE